MDSVAASRNPRARSIAVSPAVMALVIVKRGAKLLTSELAPEGAVLKGGEERVHLAVHEQGYRVDRQPDGALRFRRPDGRPLSWPVPDIFNGAAESIDAPQHAERARHGG